jgi:hypothetical protein
MVAVLVVLVVLADGGYAAVRQIGAGTTVVTPRKATLEIIVSKQAAVSGSGQTHPDSPIVFDKTITMQRLVHDTQYALDSLPQGSPGPCPLQTSGAAYYAYGFIFFTNGATTEQYAGLAECATWSVVIGGNDGPTAFAVGVPNATLNGVNLLTALHQQTGMPLPSGWSATLPAN